MSKTLPLKKVCKGKARLSTHEVSAVEKQLRTERPDSSKEIVEKGGA